MAEKQDPGYREADLLRDLDRLSGRVRQAAPRPASPAERRRG